MHQPVTANRPITRNRGCTKPGTLHSSMGVAGGRIRREWLPPWLPLRRRFSSPLPWHRCLMHVMPVIFLVISTILDGWLSVTMGAGYACCGSVSDSLG
jgi:hypothetical protein